ncbi:expressed unknown protein [Seminavis robusta]|uniref:NAD(P)-binding domain-containing protein n=1 Tax=Seminavis robusta TaxID=568900 RepID=A0A9N8HMZ3_9STRA|nr:expressed unknown protein [Seminavis robusta]|eukprot:Sro1165_g248120.1 n/a (268) ;mRNA; f:21758-22561
MTSADATSTTTTLVVGATGATGRWVVKLLLDQGQNVKVVVRSKKKMLNILEEMGTKDADRLSITEASLLDLSDAEMQDQVKDCNAVVSCLGHTLDFKGLWGHPRKLVTQATKRLTAAIAEASSSSTTSGNNQKTKFILMGSDGVANPNGQDDKRTSLERTIIVLLRLLIPPHPDNEKAAAHVHSLGTNHNNLEWAVVRPTDLIDGEPTGYFQLFDKPQGGLFGAGVATRSHVAQCMVQFILDQEKWEKYKGTMPVLHDIPTAAKSEL